MVVSFFCFLGIYSQKLARRCDAITTKRNLLSKLQIIHAQDDLQDDAVQGEVKRSNHDSDPCPRLGWRARCEFSWASPCWPASSSSSTFPPWTSCTAPVIGWANLAGAEQCWLKGQIVTNCHSDQTTWRENSSYQKDKKWNKKMWHVNQITISQSPGTTKQEASITTATRALTTQRLTRSSTVPR